MFFLYKLCCTAGKGSEYQRPPRSGQNSNYKNKICRTQRIDIVALYVLPVCVLQSSFVLAD